MLSSVMSGECDFGIRFIGSQVSGADFEPIHTYPSVLAMPRKHELAARKTLDWFELTRERQVAVADIRQGITAQLKCVGLNSNL